MAGDAVPQPGPGPPPQGSAAEGRRREVLHGQPGRLTPTPPVSGTPTTPGEKLSAPLRGRRPLAARSRARARSGRLPTPTSGPPGQMPSTTADERGPASSWTPPRARPWEGRVTGSGPRDDGPPCPGQRAGQRRRRPAPAPPAGARATPPDRQPTRRRSTRPAQEHRARSPGQHPRASGPAVTAPPGARADSPRGVQGTPAAASTLGASHPSRACAKEQQRPEQRAPGRARRPPRRVEGRSPQDTVRGRPAGRAYETPAGAHSWALPPVCLRLQLLSSEVHVVNRPGGVPGPG